MPGKAAPGSSARVLAAWLSHSERVISFHPVPGYARLCTRDADTFWQKIRSLVEEGYRLQ